jgi:hypothetical protein
MAKTTKPKAAGPEDKGLRIVAKREGFRRAGHQFGSQAVELSLADLTSEQVEQLRNEPMLVVTDVDMTPAPTAQT